MKMKDIITEEVDMSFWAEIDSHVNPDAFRYANKQVLRQEMLTKAFDGTAIFTKPVRQTENTFSNVPKSAHPKSAGYAGNIDVQVRAGHITDRLGKKILKVD
jgi:hypothetical protein